MSKFRFQTKEYIPKEREIVADVSHIIESYANVEYDRVSQLMEKFVRQLVGLLLNPIIQFNIDPKILDQLTQFWIQMFGWTYSDFKTISDREYARQQVLYRRPAHDTLLLQFLIDAKKFIFTEYAQLELITEDLLPFLHQALRQWGDEEGYYTVK